MASAEPQKGDHVSWNWGGGAPGGTVAETKHEGKIAIESKRGNIIKKNASADNPAVRVERSGNDVVKRASELTVEAKAPENKKGGGDGEEGTGGKRKAGSHQDQGDEKENKDGEGVKEAGDQYDPHLMNKEGKEVKKGGKAANKQQKKHQDEDVKGKTDVSKTSNKGHGEEEKGKRGKIGEMAGSEALQDDENMVSTRTRSHGKAA
ncbi:hypothetical protein GGS21DRAFT_111766 [Xylaria nigripes]|nr:hypothetical protein GGS21DRAFT_111766 [Xylaria nigripes]